MNGLKSFRGSLLAVAINGLAFLATGNAIAATIGTYSVNPTTNDGLAIPGFYPNVGVDLIYDDNLLRTETNQQDTFVLRLLPEALLVRTSGKHLFRVGYQGDYAWHEALGSEDYNDHFIGADANLDLNPKTDLNLLASYRREHEPRGGAGTVNTAEVPNLWDEWIAAATVVYGRRTAKAQITGALEYRNRDYTNNNQFPRDHDDIEASGIFYYNVGPKTHIIVEPSYVNMDYHEPINNRDNTVTRLLAGLTWSFAAKTSGEVKVGWVQKDYVEPVYPDNSGLGIDAKVIWRPKSYSTVTTTVSRDIYDSNAGSGTISFEALILRLDWEHGLTRLLELQTGLIYEHDKFDTPREDTLWSAYAGLSYKLTPTVSIAASYDFSTRDVTNDPTVNDYDAQQVMLSLKTSFE